MRMRSGWDRAWQFLRDVRARTQNGRERAQSLRSNRENPHRAGLVQGACEPAAWQSGNPDYDQHAQ